MVHIPGPHTYKSMEHWNSMCACVHGGTRYMYVCHVMQDVIYMYMCVYHGLVKQIIQNYNLEH